MRSLAGTVNGLLGAVRRRGAGPLVSVIVPFYNVQGYLDECLRSVLNQSISNLEVIAVDDGSTDGSAKVASHFAASDDRVTLLSQRNQGPGAARNLALNYAKGTYLAFVDSDDRLPVDTLKALVQSALTNKADVVVGAIRRFNSTRSWVPRWVKAVHSDARTGVALTAVPELLRNNYPVGKVFRTDFWRRQHLAFREGVIYEDQPLIAQMYLRASRINVLTNITYDYRAREDRSSISQRPEELGDLRDRVAAWHLTLDTLRNEAPSTVLRGWYETIYGTHLHWYLNSDSIPDPEYWTTLRSSLLTLRNYEPVGALDKLTAEKRVALLLLAADEQDAMVAFRNAGGYELGRFPSEPTADGLRHELPVPSRLLADMPPDVLVSPVQELGLRQQLVRGGWDDRGDRRVLCLAGHAYIPFFDLTTERVRIVLFARNTKTEAVVYAAIERCDDPMLSSSSNNEIADYFGSGYSAEFDVDALAGATGDQSRWELFVRVSAGAFTLTEPVRNLSGRGGLGEASALAVDPDRRLRLVSQANRHVGVEVIVERPRVIVDHVVLHGRDLVLAFRSTDGVRLRALHFDAEGGRHTPVSKVKRIAEGGYESVVRVPGLETQGQEAVVSWTVRAEDATGRRHPLSWPEGRLNQVPLGSGALRAYASAAGNFKLEEYPRGGIMVTALVDAPLDGLEVVGEVMAAEGFREYRFLSQGEISTIISRSATGAQLVGVMTASQNPATSGAGTMAERVAGTAADGAGQKTRVPVVLGRLALLALPLAVADKRVIVERDRGRFVSVRLAKIP